MMSASTDSRPEVARVVIAGVSARAMAESAVRAGYAVVTADAYADLDLDAIADARLVVPYTAAAAAAVVRGLAHDDGASRDARGAARRAGPVADGAVCYVSNFENHPDAIRELSRGRDLWGNSPATIVAVRAPSRLARALADAGVAAPRVRATAPRRGTRARPEDADRRWLLKPRASGGGHGITEWHAGSPVPRECVLQERIAGAVGSITFAADGRRCVPFAMTRQLVGDRRFGAPPFRYCGNILAPADDRSWGRETPLWDAAVTAAAAVTRAFGLIGVNGLDFVVHRGQPVPIEVNPRFTAAMELAERRDGYSVFAAHAAGCTDALATVPTAGGGIGAVGKALVFARRATTAGDLGAWLRDPDVRDVPRPGAPLPAGGPICTIFASGGSVAECYAQLTERAASVYDQLSAIALCPSATS